MQIFRPWAPKAFGGPVIETHGSQNPPKHTKNNQNHPQNHPRTLRGMVVKGFGVVLKRLGGGGRALAGFEGVWGEGFGGLWDPVGFDSRAGGHSRRTKGPTGAELRENRLRHGSDPSHGLGRKAWLRLGALL